MLRESINGLALDLRKSRLIAKMIHATGLNYKYRILSSRRSICITQIAYFESLLRDL
jgi:hypothetical protein